jgi:hypothetical protein
MESQVPGMEDVQRVHIPPGLGLRQVRQSRLRQRRLTVPLPDVHIAQWESFLLLRFNVDHQRQSPLNLRPLEIPLKVPLEVFLVVRDLYNRCNGCICLVRCSFPVSAVKESNPAAPAVLPGNPDEVEIVSRAC